MSETFSLISDLASAIGATLAGVSSIALYRKQTDFQTFQTKRFALQDFRRSDAEDCTVQLQQFLLGDYFLCENGNRYSLKQILSDYEVFNQASDSHIYLIANNHRLFKENISVPKVEEEVYHLVERILRQVESVAAAEVDVYEYLDTAKFLLNALKGLEHCGLGAFDTRRKSQLARVKALL